MKGPVDVKTAQSIRTVAHEPKSDRTPDDTGVLEYRYRDSKPPAVDS
jgi:hypothetical protein